MFCWCNCCIFPNLRLICREKPREILRSAETQWAIETSVGVWKMSPIVSATFGVGWLSDFKKVWYSSIVFVSYEGLENYSFSEGSGVSESF